MPKVPLKPAYALISHQPQNCQLHLCQLFVYHFLFLLCVDLMSVDVQCCMLHIRAILFIIIVTRLGLSEFCTKTMKILRTIFMNSVLFFKPIFPLYNCQLLRCTTLFYKLVV